MHTSMSVYFRAHAYTDFVLGSHNPESRRALTGEMGDFYGARDGVTVAMTALQATGRARSSRTVWRPRDSCKPNNAHPRGSV